MNPRPKFFLYIFISFAILVISIAGVASLSFIKDNGQSKSTARNIVFSDKFQINSTQILIGYARTSSELELGLSFQKELKEDQALLFIFSKSNRDGIWMKDMNFPIDVIWFDENFYVLFIKNDFSPNSFPEIVYPPTPSRYVLETRAGFAQRHQIRIGDQLKKAN